MARIKNIAGHLVRIELWPVAFFVGASIIWPYLLPFAVGVAASFWLVRLVAYGRLSVRTPADWPLAILVLLIPVTLAITTLPETTNLQTLRLLSGIALYFAIANWASSRKRLNILILGVALAGLGLALAAPFSVQWSAAKLVFVPTALYERFSILVSDTVHPNVLAGSLVILLPITLAWFVFNWQEMNWLQRFAVAFLNLILIGVLILTQSRGAWIALAVVLLALFMLRWRWGWLLLLVVFVLTILAISQLGTSTILEVIASGTTVGDLNGRVEIWSRALFMLQDFPYTGIGMGTFGETVGSLYPFFLLSIELVPHAHNLFLQVAVDLGIPGLICWLAILLLMIWTSWQIYQAGKERQSGWITSLGAGLLLSQLALITHGMTDAVTWGMVRPAPLVWSIWGIVVAARLLILPLKANPNQRSNDARDV